MTELPAGGASSRTRRWRDWLVGYLLIQAAIVLACLLLLSVPLPQPPEHYRLTEAMLSAARPDSPSACPITSLLAPTADAPQVFTLPFDRPPGARDQAWSVLVPRFISGVEVAVNGADILDSRRHPAANRPDRNTPEIVTIPAVLLHDGSNVLTVRLHVWGPLTGFLDNVYVGPDEALRPAYETRALLFLALPVVFAAWQAILAVLLGVMWLKRRHEPAYGILAAAMALGVVRAFATAPVTAIGLCRPQCRSHRLGAARSRLRGRLRRRLPRHEIAAIHLAGFRAGISGRRRRTVRATRAGAERPICCSARRRCCCRLSWSAPWPATPR